MKTPFLAALATATIASPIAAQVRFETGGGAAHLDQLSPSSLTSLGGGVDAAFGLARFQFSGSADDHIGVGVAGTLRSSVRAQLNPSGWHIELGPTAHAARDIGAQWSRALSADLRVEHTIGRLTLQGGWQNGIASTGAGPASWYRPEFGAELRLGNLSFGPTWQTVFARDRIPNQQFFADTLAASRDTLYRSRIRDVRDVGFALKWATGPLSFSGHITQRFGSGISTQRWWEGIAAVRVSPIMSLTMKSGRLASDVILGLRGGNYTTLGVRVDILQRAAGRERADNAALAVVKWEGAGRIRLRFTLAPGVRRAALASDLTEWRATALTRTDDGHWEIVLAASPGIHRVNIRTDEGPWCAPPGLPSTEDGFGANVGLLVLEH